MFRSIFLFGMMWCVGYAAVGQRMLKIHLTDSEQKPITGAILSIPDLLIRLANDSLGDFNIQNLPEERLQFWITAPGYGVYADSISKKETGTRSIQLKRWTNTMKELIVVGNGNERLRNTPFQISILSTSDMRKEGALNIAEGLSRLPGVYLMGSGPSIGKPIIRGLYGSRVQVLLLGMRFDNQQWQDEHGLGLNDMGTDHLEVLRGPASIYYGPEAIGGVIQVIEEESAPVGKTLRDLNFKLNSNTGGVYTDVGWRKNNGKKQWRLRLGGESHGDYSDGNRMRILNTRFGGIQIKGSLKFQKGSWLHINHAMFSWNRFGFIMDSLNNGRKLPDARWSRSLDGPYHQVILGVYTSSNTLLLKKSRLKLDFGTAFNWRMENEGGGAISINMFLSTLSGQCQWIKPVNTGGEFISGITILAQNNLNLGSRILIPDAYTFESGLYGLIRIPLNSFFLESGIRADVKNIRTIETGMLNNVNNQQNLSLPGTDIIPFQKTFNALNASCGLSWNKISWLTIKALVSSGYRPGNLAELSANGLHEGTMRWELGNANLKVEQNINTEVSIYLSKPFIQSGLTFYRNSFKNYIYLESTGKEYVGFQIFKFVQSDAILKGGEFYVTVKPSNLRGIEWKNDFSWVQGILVQNSNKNLPFIPSPRLQSSFYFPFIEKKSSSFSLKCFVGYKFQFAYNLPGAFETTSPAYHLWNMGFSGTFKAGKQLAEWSINAQNLTNNVYLDPLSRFRYYGINNMGRNIYINLKLPF